MGASDAEVQARIGHLEPDEDCEVLPENWPILQWFIEVYQLTIWVGHACARMDVTAIRDDAKMSGRKIKSAHYKGLKIMFDAYCDAINERELKRVKDAR